VTRRKTFTQSQLRAVAQIVKEHRVSVRLDLDGSVTLYPPAGSSNQQPAQLESQLDKGLGKGLSKFFDRPSKPARPDIDDILAAVAKMDPNSRKVLSGGYLWEYDSFKAHLAKKPLNKREIAALDALSKFGVGVVVESQQVKMGGGTEQRLEARGYMETRPHEQFPDNVGFYILTEEGSKAHEALRR
jgi:hypothetical protein